MTDIIEELLAFRYATTGRLNLSADREACPVCGRDLEEDDDGELHCPVCDG